jgi:hypothetical protein
VEVFSKLRVVALVALIVGWIAVTVGAYLAWGDRGFSIAAPVACLLVSLMAVVVRSRPRLLSAVYRSDCDAKTVSSIRSQLSFLAVLGFVLAVVPAVFAWRGV